MELQAWFDGFLPVASPTTALPRDSTSQCYPAPYHRRDAFSAFDRARNNKKLPKKYF
jgi:hypothetical protein